MTPWEALCVNLIRPYTLKGKDGSQIDFMCLTMIDPASSWFEIVELPVMETITPFVKTNTKGTKVHKNIYFPAGLCLIHKYVSYDALPYEHSVLMLYLKHHRSADNFALIGHSTGCQNSIHFLKVGASIA